jgi:hypothetical protein
VLREVTKKRWPAAKDFNSKWTKLEGSRRQVFKCKDVVSEEGNTHHVVIHIDVLLGKFLMDGSPVGKLSEDIVSNEEYQRLFQTSNFQALKDQTGVFTTSEIHGRIYSFHLSPKRYLVVKETTTEEGHPQRPPETMWNSFHMAALKIRCLPVSSTISVTGGTPART